MRASDEVAAEAEAAAEEEAAAEAEAAEVASRCGAMAAVTARKLLPHLCSSCPRRATSSVERRADLSTASASFRAARAAPMPCAPCEHHISSERSMHGLHLASAVRNPPSRAAARKASSPSSCDGLQSNTSSRESVNPLLAIGSQPGTWACLSSPRSYGPSTGRLCPEVTDGEREVTLLLSLTRSCELDSDTSSKSPSVNDGVIDDCFVLGGASTLS